MIYNNAEVDVPAPQAYIRFLNAIPQTDMAIDIYINDRLIAEGVPYQGFTDYFKAIPGNYTMSYYQTGTNTLLERETFIIHDGMVYTAAAIREEGNYDMELIGDTPKTPDPTLAFIRFINLVPDSEGVDIIMDRRTLITELEDNEVSRYLAAVPGDHTLNIRLSDSRQMVVSHPNLYLEGGKYYSAYVVGMESGNPEIQVLIPLEGVTYLQFEQ